MFRGQRIRPKNFGAPVRQMVSILLGLTQASHLNKDLSQEAGLFAPSVSVYTHVSNTCLRLTLGL